MPLAKASGRAFRCNSAPGLPGLRGFRFNRSREREPTPTNAYGLTMRPLIFDMLFHDDRQFVMEVTRTKNGAMAATAMDQWSVITRRNVPGYPPTRIDSFETREEAQRFYESLVTKTPLASLGGKPMDPEPTLDEYRAWLRSKGLTDRDIGVN